MTPEYSPRNALEHEERARELVERGEREAMRFVPLIAAVLAVLAGLSNIYAGRLSERMIALKNEAVLHEVKASDTWAEYQADSIKAHLYEIQVQAGNGQLATAMKAKAKQYRGEQVPLRDEAHRNEAERDRDLLASQDAEVHKMHIDVAVALFEIAIVLTSIAALMKRSWLLGLAAIGGGVGVIFGLAGMTGSG